MTAPLDGAGYNDPPFFAQMLAIQKRVNKLHADGFNIVAPPLALPTAPPAAVRATISDAMRDFFARRWDDSKPRMLIRAATGASKTELLIQRIVGQIPFDRDAKRRPWRVIYMVPAHRLGRQLTKRIRKAIEERGLANQVTVAVYEGRGDPFGAPGSQRQPLCDNLDEVGLALKAAADVNTAVCGSSKTGGRYCRFRASCRYFAQIEDCAKADIVIMAHNFLFDGLRKYQQRILNNVNCVIIEEDIADNITNGSVSLSLSTFDEETLDKYPVLTKGQRNAAKTAELDAIHAKIQHALDLIDAGQSPEEAVQTAALTMTEAEQAWALNRKRKIDPKQYPGMPLPERKLRAAEARFNTRIRPIVATMHAFGEIAGSPAGSSGAGERLWIDRGRLQVPGLRTPHQQFDNFAAIWASATTRPDRARLLYLNIEIIEPPIPAAPHQHIHLRLGAHGKGAFSRRPRKIEEMRDNVRLGMVGKKKGLVITH
jgi:hypothetical protein